MTIDHPGCCAAAAAAAAAALAAVAFGGAAIASIAAPGPVAYSVARGGCGASWQEPPTFPPPLPRLLSPSLLSLAAAAAAAQACLASFVVQTTVEGDFCAADVAALAAPLLTAAALVNAQAS